MITRSDQPANHHPRWKNNVLSCLRCPPLPVRSEGLDSRSQWFTTHCVSLVLQGEVSSDSDSETELQRRRNELLKQLDIE